MRTGQSNPSAAPKQAEDPAPKAKPPALHPILAEARRNHAHAFTDRRGVLRLRQRRCVNLHVSRTHFDAALQLMNRLFGRLSGEGYTFKIDPDGQNTRACKDGVGAIVGIRESIREQQRSLTAEEKRRRRLNPDAYISDLTEFVPTGRFILFIEMYYSGNRRECPQVKYASEPLLLDAFVKRMQTAIPDEKRHEQERAEQQRRWDEERRQREEAERRRVEEQRRVDQLNDLANCWSRGVSLDAFLDAVDAQAIRTGAILDPNGDLARWLAWAREYAARLDPL